MAPMLVYFVKINLAMAILFPAYYLLLRKEKFFRLNRIILLSILALSFILPLLPVIRTSGIGPLQGKINDINPFSRMGPGMELFPPGIPGGANSVPGRATVPASAPVFSWTSILVCCYGLVAAGLLFRFLKDLFRLFALLTKSKRNFSGGVWYCEHGQDLPPFSFFRYLVFNPLTYGPEQSAQIIAHERVHIRQGHTLDLLFAEAAHILLWPNPLAMGVKRAIKLNLEFIVDKEILDMGIDRKAYQLGILHCLNPRAFQLANLFNSSKIKLRIKMMNAKKSPARNLFKYALALPMLAAAYFLVNPVMAGPMSVKADKIGALPASRELKAFEGVYQFEKNKDSYIRITASGTGLILKQIWDGKEIPFTQKSELEFSGQDGKFPLKFSKDQQGNITQVLAFDKDIWTKVTDYKPDNVLVLEPAQLKAFEGFFTMKTENGETAYIQIETTDNGLLLRQGWDGVEIRFLPRAPLEFICRERSFSLIFTKDNNGMVTQVLAFNKDLWNRVKDPSTAVMKKEIPLDEAQVKAVVGKYTFQFEQGKDEFILITAAGKGIVLKQLWDNREFRFVAQSPLEFFCKQDRFPLKFVKDKDGAVTQVLAFDRDLWTRVKSQ